MRRSLLLALAVALALDVATLAVVALPGCAVIDGLGGDDERPVDSNGTAPDAGDAVDLPEVLPMRYRARFIPEVMMAQCNGDVPLPEVVVEVMPDGRIDLLVPPFLARGFRDNVQFDVTLECEADSRPVVRLLAMGDGTRFEGMYEVVEIGAMGQMIVEPI